MVGENQPHLVIGHVCLAEQYLATYLLAFTQLPWQVVRYNCQLILVGEFFKECILILG